MIINKDFFRLKTMYKTAEYRQAISILLANENCDEMIYPIIYLIYTTIEVELKNMKYKLANYKSYKSIKLSNNHNIKNIVNSKYIENAFSTIEDYNCFKSSVNYFYSILGDDTYLSSKYCCSNDMNEYELKDLDIKKITMSWSIYSDLYFKAITSINTDSKDNT